MIDGVDWLLQDVTMPLYAVLLLGFTYPALWSDQIKKRLTPLLDKVVPGRKPPE